MCGFIQRVTDSPYVKAVLLNLGMDGMALPGGQFRPGSVLDGLIIENHGQAVSTEAVWWYLLDKDNGYKPNYKVTSFNARNLDSRLWKTAIKQRRGIVIADAIGESNPVKGTKKKNQYLMQSKSGLILGAIYNVWETEHGSIYSTAIITRPPIPGFSKYHEKSIPLFLPSDKDFIDLWLSASVETHSEIDQALADPKLFSDLAITQVKTYKDAEPIGDTEVLKKTA